MSLEHAYHLPLLLCVDFSILELTLSTFLGFGSALLVESIISYYSGKKCKEQLVNNLIIELESIHNIVNSLEDGKVYMQPYSIPIWNGACATGIISSLNKESYYCTIYETFASISEANLIEIECYKIVVTGNNFIEENPVFNTLKKNREDLSKQINRGLRLMKGE